METPWGTSQTVREIAPGILDVSTAGHGGIRLSPERNALVPDYMRNPSGWYEEDIEWAIPAVVFPEAFQQASGKNWTPRKPSPIRHAIKTLRDWRPEAYERWFKETIPPGVSFKKEEAAFKERHKHDYVVLAAWGSWHPKVPEGFVGVFAGRGGRLPTGGYPEDVAYFMVPEEEYDARGPFGFVVDPERHQQVEAFD